MEEKILPAAGSKEVNEVTEHPSGFDNFLPINTPSYSEVLSFTNLNALDFTEKDYEKYRESLSRRMDFIVNQVKFYAQILEYSVDTIEGSKREHKVLSRVAQEQFDMVNRDIQTILHQKDLFTTDQNSYLVEDQINNLAEQIRGLKEIIAAVAKFGSYQAPSLTSEHLDASFQRGPFQQRGSDLSADYLRFSAAPEKIEDQLHQLIPLPEGTIGKTFLYGSAMGALASITGLALSEVSEKNRHLAISASGYFETAVQADMWQRMLPEGSIVQFNGDDEGSFEEALKQNPQIIMTERVGNAETLPVVPIEKITSHPFEGAGPRFIVIDYTISGPLFEIAKYIPKINDNDVLVLVTSLQKLYQEGDDLVPGGMATFAVNDRSNNSIERIEMHIKSLRGVLGVNVPLDSIISLKLTNQDFIRSHAEQIAHNVLELSNDFPRLPKAIQSVNQPPILSEGRSEGMFFNVRFVDNDTKNRFISKAIELAAKYGVKLSEGTSFGYRYTRMFTNRPPAHDVNPENPVVRIAPGIENERQIAVLKRIFEEAAE